MKNQEIWPVFRSNACRTGFLPVRSRSSAPCVEYKVKVGDYLYSSPVVSKSIYFLSYSKDQSRICALDRVTGAVCWTYDLNLLPPYPWYSVAVHQSNIYVSDYGRFFALDAFSGKLLRQNNQSEKWFALTSAVCDDQAVYVGSNYMSLHAFSLSSLEEKWSFNTKSNITADISVSDNGIVVVSQKPGVSFVNCVDKMSGEPLWTSEFLNASIRACPVISGDIVYIVSVRFREPQKYNLYALNVQNGVLIWKKEFEPAEHNFNSRSRNNKSLLGSSPSIAGNEIYIGLPDGHLYSLNINNQEINWSFLSSGFIESSPAVTNDALYFGSMDGTLHTLDRHTGSERWNFKASSSICASPAVTSESVFFGSIDGWFHALSL